MNLSTGVLPKTNGHVVRIIKTIKDVLRSCVIDFKGNLDDPNGSL